MCTILWSSKDFVMEMIKPAVKVQTSPKSRARKQVRVDAIRLFSVFVLYIEIVDTTRTGTVMVNHTSHCYLGININNAVL